MASPLNLGQIVDATDLSIQKMFKKAASPELNLKKYYNFRTTEDYIEKDSGLSGLQIADFVNENAEINEDVPILTNKQTYTQQFFGTVYTLSLMAWKLGIKRRALDNIAKELQDSLNSLKEQLAAERLTNGWSTSYTHNGSTRNTSITVTGGDGVKQFSSAHTREDGGTNINNTVYDGTTYSLPFDYTAYKAANRTAALLVDPRGIPFPAKLNLLVCKTGSSVFTKAMEINGAIQRGFIPESSDRDAAALPPFQILELDFLTQDAYWFMADTRRALTDKYGYQHIESTPNTLDPVHIVYKTKEMQFSAYTIFQQGFNDVSRAWVGSAGDSSSN